MRRFYQHWFLSGLVTLLLVGAIWPTTMEPLAQAVPRQLMVATVLFLMSVTLDSHSMWRAMQRPGAVLLAVAINAGLAPPLAWLIGRPLDAQLAAGLIIAASVPCTLASAAVWTRRAGGNDAVALLVTMITNLASFLVVPAWLAILVGTEVDSPFDGLVWRLIRLAVLPVLAGQLLRRADWVARLADRLKPSIGIAAQLGILSMVLVGAVSCGRAWESNSGHGALGMGSALLMLLAVVLLHLSLLAFGFWSARGLGMPRADCSAVALAGSQKTLMIGLDIALVFGGLAVLPMVAYHMVQLVLDTIIADRLRSRTPLVEAPQSD